MPALQQPHQQSELTGHRRLVQTHPDSRLTPCGVKRSTPASNQEGLKHDSVRWLARCKCGLRAQPQINSNNSLAYRLSIEPNSVQILMLSVGGILNAHLRLDGRTTVTDSQTGLLQAHSAFHWNMESSNFLTWRWRGRG